MSKALRFLIPDGYSPASRAQFEAVGMRLAGQLYADLLTRRLPGAEYDIWYSSDEGATVPTDAELSQYAGVIWPGCNLTIYHDDDPRVQRHKDVAYRAYEAGIPQFGSCWAIQLACTVAGGRGNQVVFPVDHPVHVNQVAGFHRLPAGAWRRTPWAGKWASPPKSCSPTRAGPIR